MNWYFKLFIWVGVVGVVFAYLWRKGYLLRVTNYVGETREELRKCTWPTVQELKDSTIVVLIAFALLGAYTVGVDSIFRMLIRLLV